MTVSPMDMEGSQDFKHYRDKTKKKIYILGAIIGVLVILAITFIALYASKDSCDDESNTAANSKNSANKGNAGKMAVTTASTMMPHNPASATASTTTATPASATASTTTATPAPATASTTTATPVCQTDACKKTANSILEKMDTQAKPCDDFMAFACGKFYKTAKIDADKTSKGAFDDGSDRNAALYQELLQSPLQNQSKTSFEYKMQKFYNACLDEDAMEKHGLVDYTNDTRKEWPTLNSSWNESSFELQDVVDKYAALYTPVLFYSDKKADTRGNVPMYMLQINHPYFLLDKARLLGGRDSPNVKAYEAYYKDVAIALGADNTTAAQDAHDVITLYRVLARIYMDPTQEMDTTLTNNPTTLGDMNNDYPYLDWVKVFQSMLCAANVSIDSTQKINVVDKNYLVQLGDILNNTNNLRSLQNAFGFEQAKYRIGSANKKMRQLNLDFRMVTDGVTEASPRSETCAFEVDTTFNVGMGKLVSGKRFSSKAKTFMDNMIDNLKMAYMESFENVEWMQNKTKEEALKKAEEIQALIGIQSKDFDYADIDRLYKDFKGEGDYNTNYLLNDNEDKIQGWNQLNQVVDKAIWTSSMTIVNAYYDQSLNEVVFPLGILQPPFFDQNKPSYMNYGGIGMVIGHEIGHGFDSEGRHHDDKGRIRDWWTPNDNAEYNQKAQCFIDQHNNFTMEINGTEHHLNGDLTITEDLADHMGTTHSFRAYSLYSEKNKNHDWPLPGLTGLTDKQLFFVALGQVWCEKATDERLLYLLNEDTHTNAKYRIIGSLQNSKDFADAYGCKVGSYMNPAKKCNLMRA